MDHTASKSKGLAWLAGAIIFAVLLAVGVAPLAHLVPWSWEEKLGDVFNPTADDCEGTKKSRVLFKQLVDRLYPLDAEDGHMPIDIHIVHGGTINAYAELGGHINLNAGLLEQAESPEEIAGVLAHEMEHVHRRHILEGTLARIITSGSFYLVSGDASSTKWAGYFLNMNFTRGQEAQADEGGLKRLQKAHIDNQGFAHFFERMEDMASPPPFLSDHPSNKTRFDMTRQFDNHDVKPIMSKDDWKTLRNYCR